ncbi:PAIP1 protein, partial [Emberiza fucata]|nr:PAIP1 protein [Emberiza fucata]
SGSAEEKQHQPGGLFPQQEPLRPPKTAPLGTGMAEHLQKTGIPSGSQDKVSVLDSGPEMAEPQLAVDPVATSNLSAKAPEFYPSGYNQNFNQNFTDSSFEDRYDGYLTLAEYVQDFLNHLTEQPGCFETEIEQFAETLNGWVIADEALQELVELIYQQVMYYKMDITPLLPNVQDRHSSICYIIYENRDEATKGDETTRKQFHAFVLFLAELYLNLEIKGTKGQVTRAVILQEGLRELLNALFSNPVDSNLICAVKLLKVRQHKRSQISCLAQNILTFVVLLYFRDVKHMLLKLVELRSSNWGRVHGTTPHAEATPENDPNYFMNEPTFYTSDGVPFTAADPDYQEKYQELLEREDLFSYYEENGADLSGPGELYFDEIDDEMDPEIEEAYEKFCLESEHNRKQ